MISKLRISSRPELAPMAKAAPADSRPIDQVANAAGQTDQQPPPQASSGPKLERKCVHGLDAVDVLGLWIFSCSARHPVVWWTALAGFSCASPCFVSVEKLAG